MFYALNLKAARWWLLGLAAGLLGWAVWSWVEGPGPGAWSTPTAFDAGFGPVQPGAGSDTASPGAGAGAGQGAAEPGVLPAIAEPAPPPAGQAPAPARARSSPDELRAQRERLRSQEMELAQRILDDPQASEARKTEAQRELLELLQRSRRELEIEQLLAAAGVSDAAVSIGDSGVQVVVPYPVTAQGAARIGELVARMAGARREDISIIDSLTAFGPQGPWQESGRPR